MNHLGTMYATKRRRRNSKSVRVQSKDVQTKSNPSKRHRERLNAELDMLARLLPYEQSVLSKLDKLSILRLSVSYLRTKSYFQAILHKERGRQANIHEIGLHKSTSRDLLYPEMLMEGDLILQALNGFLLILTCDGEVFYASHTVETYLGFHQSDICHQSVYELVHSEDREELQRHLLWNSHLPNDRANATLQEAFHHEKWQYLERNFTVRFRCLLDNTSGFLRLDIRGRIKILYGQNHKTEEPPLALFAICTPFGPPSLLEMPQKDSMFKSKHKLDLSLVSMDQRGKQLLAYSDTEMANKGVYDLVHFDDLAYVASAHQELLKTGASGLIAYRLLSKDNNKWQWLQTSARLVYKNSKPDFILCTHRPLMEEEGRDLLSKRTMDFKVTYLDGGFGAMNDRSGLLTDSDLVLRCQRNRRYKSQIRDLISNCRPSSKRKIIPSSEEYSNFDELSSNNHTSSVNHSAHAAVTAASNPYHPNAPPPAAYPYPAENINSLSPYAAAAAAAAMPQNLFTAAMDHNSRTFLAPENFFHYSRHALSTYYSDYHPQTQYPGNGFLEHMTNARTAHCFSSPYSSDTRVLSKSQEKLYGCQLGQSGDLKYNGSETSSSNRSISKSCCDGYMSSVNHSPTNCNIMSNSSIQPLLTDTTKLDMSCHQNSLNFGLTGPTNDCLSVIKHKSNLSSLGSILTTSSSSSQIDTINTVSSAPSIASAFSSTTHNINNNVDQSRHSVLMWDSTNLNRAPAKYATTASSMTALHETNKASPVVSCKWNGSLANPKPLPPHPSIANSPNSAKVPITRSAYGASAYSVNEVNPIELPLAKQDHHVYSPLIFERKLETSPLLSISEVTNALLSHD